VANEFDLGLIRKELDEVRQVLSRTDPDKTVSVIHHDFSGFRD
jgi:hypothetical protein